MSSREPRLVPSWLPAVLVFPLTAAVGALVMSLTERPVDAAVRGAVFGAVLAVLMARLQRHAGAARGIAGSPAVTQRRELVIGADFGTAMELCVAAAGRVQGCRVRRVDSAAGIVAAAPRMSLRNWGQRVRFEVERVGQGEHRIRIESRPGLPLTFVDYGANLDNVTTAADFLGSHRASAAAAACA